MATSLGPLTTSFSAPTGCIASDIIWQLPITGATGSYFLQGQPSAASCFPANYDPHTTASYVPGVCPQEYTAVRYREGKSITSTDVLTCCPTYALFQARPTGMNVPFMSTMACQSFFGESGTITATQMSGTSSRVARVTYTASDVLNAYGIIVVAPSSASPSLTSAISTATKESASSPSQSTSPSTSQSSSQSNSQPPPSTGLSTAAKGGIGGGIAALLLLVLAAGWLFFIRRKRRESVVTNVRHELPTHTYKYDMGSHNAHNRDYGQSKLPQAQLMSELPTTKEKYELHS